MGLGKKFKKRVLGSVPVQDGQSIADVGCGTGVFLEIAKEKYPHSRVVGLDPDKEALVIARSRLEKKKLAAELTEGRVETLPFPDDSFDFVFSTLAFHHIPDEHKPKAIQEIHRVLRNGGKLLIADFGESRSWSLRLLLGFERHVKGNFEGLIMAGLQANNFRDVKILWKKWPGIQVVFAKK